MHLIVGAGATGTAVARTLAGRGEAVRIVTRGGGGPSHPGVERVAADAADAATLTRLATGARAIYNCANPPYHTWPRDWPPLSEALLAAAEASGAPLAITGNLYVYGRVDRPMTEDHPLAAHTVKGKVRVRMWQDAVAAYDAGRIAGVTEVRGSDFISPRHSVLEQALPALRAGRTFWAPTPLDVPHTFTYTGDLAESLIALVGDARAWGRAWHVPSPEPMTVREHVRRIAEVGGFAPPRLRPLPEVALRAVGLFNPFAREFAEMLYQFQRPYVLDASLTSRTFGLKATDLDEAIRRSLADA